ncbi:unnamed protein product, partial [Closterium sp. NIES-64]
MDGKKPIATRRGTKLLAIPLPDLGSSFASLHRSTRTPARTPAESKPAAGSSSTCRRASPRLPRDVAVALTPTLSSSPQPRAKPHHAAPHPPPRRPSAVEAGAEAPLEASGTAAPCRRPTRHAPHSPCCKLHWRRVVVVFLLLLSLAIFLLMLPALWLAHAWPLPSGGSGDGHWDGITDPQSGDGGGGGGICVAIPSSPRAFPHQELPPWHFPVALLKLLDERHSRQNSAHRGKQRGGLGKMHAVVYSAGCKALVPAAVAANRRQRMGRLRRIGAAKSVEDMEADFVVEDTKRANEMVGVYTREIEQAAEGLSMRVDVLRAHEDVCQFIGQGEEDLRRGGVEDKMVGKDGWESWKWRTKLVMDFIYVARQCLATRPKYVLLLQDDTLPAKLYDVGIERFVKEDLTHKSWGVVSLYNPQSYNWGHQHGDEYSVPCCAQALLFNVTALEGMLQYMEEHLMETNMDLLVNKYLNVSGIKGYVHVPSLFQHLVAVLRALAKEWGRGFNYSRAWSSKQPPKRCMAYPGIICNDKGIIIGLNVSNTNINGTIKGVSALTALALLDMSQNPIKDVAPLAPLTNLVYLVIYQDVHLYPPIPSPLSLHPLPDPTTRALHNLEALDIEKAPNALGNLGLLKHLVLSHGGDARVANCPPPSPLSPTFGNSAEQHMFSGKIPKELSRLKSLQFLSLNYNKLSGSIPEQLTRLANIQSINLESNYLSGTLPNIDRLKLLTDINVRSNYLSSTIPPPYLVLPYHSLSSTTSWASNVRSNYLSGTIPPRYLALPYHSLASNYFVGEVSYKARNGTSICPSESDVDNNCLRLK